ncbi:MAG: hypothetical protein M3Y58_04200 [Chloroflexota bacterium]|nr:hypothetical protein [Chloroflexota bacterium]
MKIWSVTVCVPPAVVIAGFIGPGSAFITTTAVPPRFGIPAVGADAAGAEVAAAVVGAALDAPAAVGCAAVVGWAAPVGLAADAAVVGVAVGAALLPPQAASMSTALIAATQPSACRLCMRSVRLRHLIASPLTPK